MAAKEQDHRFTIANREALIGVTLAVVNFVWWFAFAYGLGSKPPEEYSYVFGLPAWFFYSCVVGFILMAALVFFVVRFLFVEVSFEEERSGNQS
ncbi:YhdT family protein [Halobacillus amylolyticus]|uniref:YhdT family protein n=1 Tax=Halobacillus amylolyticus TaxID=2932259 RepID=A0ABY4H9L6_9BACI|nr:YhdT family protein [Halobacillus amylolyticus]UOR11573.1 YhdT family protein [Halobacillus amylolyticus]